MKYRTASFSEFSFMSHLPILSAACYITSKPVLELGAGFGSTFALHGLCAVNKRKLLTVENNATWMRQFKYYSREWHKFKLVNSFIGLPEYKQEWGLAFVDHGILGERGLALASLIEVPMVIAHDTNYERLNYHNDGHPNPLEMYKYRFDHRWFGSQTTVLSNYIDVQEEFNRMGI